MISTLEIKQQQLANGFFSVGNGMMRVLILGSCRVAPYISYLNEWNKTQDVDMFTIFSIDPFNNNWNENDERVDYMEALTKLETDKRLLGMLRIVDIFVHEWFQNAGMFNCSKEAEKNIYQFGLSPEKDICIPNFNDYFILFNDIINFDTSLRKKAIQDINVIGKLSVQTEMEIYTRGLFNTQKFYDICRLSDIPEMADYFSETILTERMFHSYNHVSKKFTLFIFVQLCLRFLKIQISSEFIEKIGKEDMFANSFTKLTEYDRRLYGYEWDEETVPLAL